MPPELVAVRPPRVVSLVVAAISPDTTDNPLDATVARALRVAMAAAPWAVSVAVAVSTVTANGSGSHSADVWNDHPRWRLRCNSANVGDSGGPLPLDD